MKSCVTRNYHESDSLDIEPKGKDGQLSVFPSPQTIHLFLYPDPLYR